MSSLFDMFSQQISGATIQQLSRQIGASEDATAKAVSGAMPVLLSALAKNTQSATGAQSLLGALDRDHDGSILDDVIGFVGRAKTEPGDAILGHVLGNRRGSVEAGIGRMSGMDGASMARLLSLLAPIVMGMLGRAKREQGLDSTGLSGYLQRERQTVERQAPDAMGMLGRLLDSDGDGQVLDDVARMGGGLLGNLFGRGR